MVPEISSLVRRSTFALIALASVGVDVAAGDGRAVGQSICFAAIWIVVAAVVAQFVPIPTDPRSKPPLWLFLLLLGLALAPFGVEPLRRNWTGDGYPLEIQMVCSLRNVGLGLAICAGWLLCLRLACVTSLFLILFSASMTNHPAVMVVLGMYTATGSIWLMITYWSGLRLVFVAPEKAVTVELHDAGERMPWIGLSFLVFFLGLALALVLVGPRRASYALGEWMPTSGGTGATDMFARYGVGDGPEETAGDNAKAAGMVETDKMIEDNKNSLIDAVNDLYGPPHKPNKDMERMVAAGKLDVIQFHGKLPDNKRPSRDFDTGRKGPKGNPKPKSQGARGVFEVQGRTPLHIRLVAYEIYEPVEKRWLEARKPVSKLIEAQGGDWMKLGFFKPNDWYLADERHQLKVAELKSNLVPTPSLLTHFRINKVDKSDYYEWDYEGVLALAGRKRTPPGVIVTTDCRTVDPLRLPKSAFGTVGATNGSSPKLGDIPLIIHPEIQKLARDWAGEHPRGWLQIDAIQRKLLSEYALDLNATAPPEHPAPVMWFLTESKRGPDYLFASAFALMLRALDYPTRICMGYYASPDAYDPETAHTPVKVTDLHFWPEVLLLDGHWMVLEPTPGYVVLGPTLPLFERILDAFVFLIAWLYSHIVKFILLSGLLFTGWIYRRDLFDSLAFLIWTWFPGKTWREQVRGAVAVLERRGRLSGKARKCRQTIVCWLRESLLKSSGPDADIYQITLMAQWAAYGQEAPPPWSQSEVLNVCHRVLGSWTLKRWRNAPSDFPNGDKS